MPPQVPVKFYKDANGNYQSTILSYSSSTPHAYDGDEDDNVFGSSGGKPTYWNAFGSRTQLQIPGTSWRGLAMHTAPNGVVYGVGNVYTQSTFSTEYGVLIWPNKESAPSYFSMGVNIGPASGFVPRSFDDFGTMVGVSTPTFGSATAAVWKAGIGMRTLNSLLDASGTGYDIYDALKINNNGQILAQARYQDDYARYVLLTPVPEPTSFLLLTPGFAWMVIRRKEKGSRSLNRPRKHPSKTPKMPQ